METTHNIYALLFAVIKGKDIFALKAQSPEKYPANLSSTYGICQRQAEQYIDFLRLVAKWRR
jgi:hypothetical protein